MSRAAVLAVRVVRSSTRDDTLLVRFMMWRATVLLQQQLHEVSDVNDISVSDSHDRVLLLIGL
jgi:hypothetical protein